MEGTLLVALPRGSLRFSGERKHGLGLIFVGIVDDCLTCSVKLK